MGFLSKLFGGGGGGGDPFAGLDPDNVEMYWILEHEISTGEENGDLKERLAKYGLKNKDQAEHVMSAYFERHGQKPEFNQAAVSVQTRIQMGNWNPQ